MSSQGIRLLKMVDFKMANNEESVYNDPNFAVICSFIDKFGELCGISNVTVLELQEKLEDTKNVFPDWVDLHVRLLRRAGKKSVSHERWEKALVKFCHGYSKVDAWEIERFGYKKSKLSVKVNLLKHLLEAQFDGYSKFKSEVNKRTAQELRILPAGRDINGQIYWYQVDRDLNFRIYREDQDDETWELIVSEKTELTKLIETLQSTSSQFKKEESTTTSENDDSKDCYAAKAFQKPKLDTGQEKEDSKPKIKGEPCEESILPATDHIKTETLKENENDSYVENLGVKTESDVKVKQEQMEETLSLMQTEHEDVNKSVVDNSEQNVCGIELNEKLSSKNLDVSATSTSSDIPQRVSVIKMAEKIQEMPQKEEVIDYHLTKKDHNIKAEEIHHSSDAVQSLDEEKYSCKESSVVTVTDLTKKNIGETSMHEKPDDCESKLVMDVKTETHDAIMENCDSVVDLSKSRHDQKLVKEIENSSPPKLKQEDLKEKMKSDRMIPFKKREIPKDVEACVSSDVDPLLRHGSRLLTVPEVGKDIHDTVTNDIRNRLSPSQNVSLLPQCTSRLSENETMKDGKNCGKFVSHNVMNLQIPLSFSEQNKLETNKALSENDGSLKKDSSNVEKMKSYSIPEISHNSDLMKQEQNKEQQEGIHLLTASSDQPLPLLHKTEEQLAEKSASEYRTPNVYENLKSPRTDAEHVSQEKKDNKNEERREIKSEPLHKENTSNKQEDSENQYSSREISSVTMLEKNISEKSKTLQLHEKSKLNSGSDVLNKAQNLIKKSEEDAHKQTTIEHHSKAEETSEWKKSKMEESRKQAGEKKVDNVIHRLLLGKSRDSADFGHRKEKRRELGKLEMSVARLKEMKENAKEREHKQDAKEISKEKMQEAVVLVKEKGSREETKNVINEKESKKETNKSNKEKENLLKVTEFIGETHQKQAVNKDTEHKEKIVNLVKENQFACEEEHKINKEATNNTITAKLNDGEQLNVQGINDNSCKEKNIVKISNSQNDSVNISDNSDKCNQKKEQNPEFQVKPQLVFGHCEKSFNTVGVIKNDSKSSEIIPKSADDDKLLTVQSELISSHNEKDRDKTEKNLESNKDNGGTFSEIKKSQSLVKDFSSEIESRKVDSRSVSTTVAKNELINRSETTELPSSSLVGKEITKSCVSSSEKLTAINNKEEDSLSEKAEKSECENNLVKDLHNEEYNSSETGTTKSSVGSEETCKSNSDSAPFIENKHPSELPKTTMESLDVKDVKKTKSEPVIDSAPVSKKIEKDSSKDAVEIANDSSSTTKEMSETEVGKKMDKNELDSVKSINEEDSKNYVKDEENENISAENSTQVENEAERLSTRNTDKNTEPSSDFSGKKQQLVSSTAEDKHDSPTSLTEKEKPEKETEEIIATQVVPQKPAGRGRRGRRGRGSYRGRLKSPAVNEVADKANPEVGQSDSSQEKPEANEGSQLKLHSSNRGGRYQRKRGRSKAVAFVDVSPPVKRSQRLQAQREKQEVEYRRIEEERRIIAEFEQKQREEDRRRRQELKEQKILEELELEEEEEDEEDEEEDEEDDKENKKKKKMKKKKRKQRRRRKGNNPWDYSSESSTSSSSSEHEEHHEEDEDDEELVFNDKSDHEFSPESESECDPSQPTKIRRARTARKVKSDSDEESEGGDGGAGEDDKPCSKCGNYDHPEWILLCDKCDAGFHTACLRPPLLIIPDGDWFCPPCEHNMLLVVLQEYLKILEQALKKKEREEMRKKRLAYVGINLDNVLKPEKKELSENEEEDLHPKRSCRARKDISYQFKEYDDMIQSAIQEELIAERGAGMGKGKDMANITEAEEKEEIAKKKRKHRRLNDLDSASDSEDDEDSDEDFRQSSGSNTHQTEEDEDDEDYNAEESDESWNAGRRRKNLPFRRSTRNRRRGYDDDFVVDDDESEDSDGRRGMRRVTCKRISYREISDSDDQDETWNKKQYQKRRRIESDEESYESDWRESHKKSNRTSMKQSRIKRRWASDSDSEDSEEIVRTTRGKKMNYQELDLLEASDEEDIKKIKKKHIRIQDFEKDSDDDDEQDKDKDEDDDEDDEEEEEDEEEDDEESDEEESEDKTKEKKNVFGVKYNVVDNSNVISSNAQCVSGDDKNSDSAVIQRSVIMSVKSSPAVDSLTDKGDESQDADLPENVSERKAVAMKDDSGLFKENGLQPDHQRLPLDYRENASPLSQSLIQSNLPQPCPSKLMMLDTCSSRSSPQARLTMLDTYSHRSTPPALHTFDSKIDRPHAMASPGRQSSPHPPPPHAGIAPPPYVGDYSTYVGPYYPPTNYGQQSSPHSRYSPQGYNGPPPPPQPPPSQPLHGQTHPFAPPYQHSPHYSYGPEGYPEGDQYEGPPQAYPGYSNYSSPIEQESQASQQQTGNYAVNSLLQRRTDGTGEEDEFNGVNDLVSYITGSHENQL